MKSENNDGFFQSTTQENIVIKYNDVAKSATKTKRTLRKMISEQSLGVGILMYCILIVLKVNQAIRLGNIEEKIIKYKGSYYSDNSNKLGNLKAE